MKKLKHLLALRPFKIFLFFILFVLSRFFFINPLGVFFDSKEYFNNFSNPSYIVAIISGHYPPHVGYNFLFWPVFHLVQFLHGNGAYGVICLQIIFGFISLYCFYEVVTYVTDKKVALYATIIASLTPLFWIINVTLMDENAYIFYFFSSLFLLIQYLKNNKKKFLHLSLILYSLAVLTLTMVILWSPIYLYIVYIKKKQKIRKVLTLLILYVVLFSIFNGLFIAYISQADPSYTFRYLYLEKGGEFDMFQLTLSGMLVNLRNFVIPILRNNTILIDILSLIALWFALKNNKRAFWFGILWILPAIYTTQWWDSLLDGRHAVLTGFGLAFLVAYLLRTKPVIFGIIVIYLLICSLPALDLLRYPIPYLQEADYVKSLPKDALFIESHFARPQVQDTIRGKILYVNEPGWSKEKFKKDVNEYLVEKKPVYISGAALSEPYGLFSGPYIHNITLSYKNPYELQFVIPHYTLREYKVLNVDDNLIIYQIVSQKSSPYPPIKHLQYSRRRIDYSDPLSWIVRRIESSYFHQ